MKNHLALLVIIGAIATSAFTSQHLRYPNTESLRWYRFWGNPGIPAQVDNPSYYTEEDQPVCADNGTSRCEVYAESGPGLGEHPNLQAIWVIITRQP